VAVITPAAVIVQAEIPAPNYVVAAEMTNGTAFATVVVTKHEIQAPVFNE
jgi:hypothetical protein